MSPDEREPLRSGNAAASSVAWAGLALAAALALALWWAWRTSQTERTFREPQDAQAPGLPAPAGDAVAGTPRELGVLGEPGEPGELGPPGFGDAHRGAPGTVLVRAVECASGAPLAGIEVELACEEPIRRRFGRATTAADGTARFAGVFAPIPLAYARRGERFAAAITAARGDVQGTRVATLRLGPGGILRGRVVDDDGAPVAGAELSLPDASPWPEPVLVPRVLAQSAADGSFALERVVDLPRLVTAREGGVFAAAWSQVQVEARAAGGLWRVSASVGPCGETLAPDLVLPRPATFSGRVLDAAGAPVAGALVSFDPRRQLLTQVNLHVAAPELVALGVGDLPGMTHFALLAGEALTASDGSFEGFGAPPRALALVATAAPDLGRVEEFPCGPWTASARVDGLEFRLADTEVFRVRLTDEAGRPVLGAAPRPDTGAEPELARAPARYAPLVGPASNAWLNSRVEFSAETADGRQVSALSLPAGDGTFAFAFPGRLASIERLAIVAPGFQARTLECRGRLRPGAAVTELELAPQAEIRLEIVLRDGGAEGPGSEAHDVFVRACALAPEPVTTGGTVRPPCCGSGVGAWLALPGTSQTLALPVQADLPFWVTVRLSRGRRSEEFVAGPFRPGEERHVLEFPALPPPASPWERAVPDAGRVDSRACDAPFSASLCAFDAERGKALAGASIWPVCDPHGSEVLVGRAWSTAADGCATLDGLCAGTWTFAVAAPGYRTALVGPLELAEPSGDVDATGAEPGEQDLGEVRLVPVD